MHCCGFMNSWIHTQSKETNQNYLAMYDFDVLKLRVQHPTQYMYGHTYSSKLRSLIWPTKSSKLGFSRSSAYQWVRIVSLFYPIYFYTHLSRSFFKNLLKIRGFMRLEPLISHTGILMTFYLSIILDCRISSIDISSRAGS